MAQSEKRATSLEWEAGSSGIVAGTPISATENPLEQQRLHTPDAVPEKAPPSDGLPIEDPLENWRRF